MGKKKHLVDSGGFGVGGASLLSILFEAATYGSPASTEAGSLFMHSHGAYMKENIEIGEGHNIRVNGLSQPLNTGSHAKIGKQKRR